MMMMMMVMMVMMMMMITIIIIGNFKHLLLMLANLHSKLEFSYPRLTRDK